MEEKVRIFFESVLGVDDMSLPEQSSRVTIKPEETPKKDKTPEVDTADKNISASPTVTEKNIVI